MNLYDRITSIPYKNVHPVHKHIIEIEYITCGICNNPATSIRAISAERELGYGVGLLHLLVSIWCDVFTIFDWGSRQKTFRSNGCLSITFC